MPSGFVDRYKGKGYQPTGWLQQVGGGGQSGGGGVTGGGGQINSTSAVSTSGGILLSTAGTVETTLLSYVMPAKTLDRLGRNALITAYGTFSTFNTGIKTARLYFGSVSISVATTGGDATIVPWWLQMSVFAQTAQSTSAGVQSIITQNIFGTVHGGCALSTGAEIMGLNSTIKVTGISSAPTAASPGDVTAFSLQVEGLN